MYLEGVAAVQTVENIVTSRSCAITAGPLGQKEHLEIVVACRSALERSVTALKNKEPDVNIRPPRAHSLTAKAGQKTDDPQA